MTEKYFGDTSFPTHIPKGGLFIATFTAGVVEEFQSGWDVQPHANYGLTVFISRDSRVNPVEPKIGDTVKTLSTYGLTIGSENMRIWLNDVLVIDNVPGRFLGLGENNDA